jgi:DNA-directed RNA polymerase subunit RPC12/RpoP
MRLIDADKGLISKIQRKTGCNFITAQEIVDSMSTVEERKQGKWIEETFQDYDDEYYSYWKCSECGRTVGDNLANIEDIIKDYPYCHCGADMRGTENE